MVALYRWALPWTVVVRARVGAGTVILGLAVAVWWLLIAGSIAGTLPAPVAVAQTPEFVTPGSLVQVSAPPRVRWSIPVSRVEFDAYNVAFDMGDEAALEASLAATEWLPVADLEVVRVVQVDGVAVQVEILAGAFAGRRGWLKVRQLRP